MPRVSLGTRRYDARIQLHQHTKALVCLQRRTIVHSAREHETKWIALYARASVGVFVCAVCQGSYCVRLSTEETKTHTHTHFSVQNEDDSSSRSNCVRTAMVKVAVVAVVVAARLFQHTTCRVCFLAT